MTPPWLPLLRQAIDEELGRGPVVAAFATVDGGAARVRHVVVRRIDDDGRLCVATDVRSAKVRQVRDCPRGELSFWLPRRREQFRLLVDVAVWSDREVDRAVWAEMSEESKQMFYWPPPGAPREPATAGPIAVQPDPPPSYAVLSAVPIEVDLLELSPRPHERRVWRRAREWAMERVNP